MQTKDNLLQLADTLRDKEPCDDYGIRHWHPATRPKSSMQKEHFIAVSKGSEMNDEFFLKTLNLKYQINIHKPLNLES